MADSFLSEEDEADGEHVSELGDRHEEGEVVEPPEVIVPPEIVVAAEI